MTCKISFFKSMRETLKHHVASVFATCLVFFIQFVVFFLNMQNLAESISDSSIAELSSTDFNLKLTSSDWLYEQIFEFTQPGYGYMVPVMIVAVLLAYDFFRYLHSKKQTDFYESLALNRKTAFLLRIATSFLVFIIPFALCIGLEMLILAIFNMATPVFLGNLLWNFVCMLVIFLITWLTAILAMVMTGHSVIALFGLGVFSAYAPLVLQYLTSAYASTYFKTYIGENNETLSYFTYLSPVGAAIKLLGNEYTDWEVAVHVKDFIIILALICALGILTYRLFVKRPAETAGRAMAFEKANPVIRILIVVPLTLYLGLYLGMVTSIGSKVWTIFGYLLGTILLNGIIESIFRFDIRGMLAHKKQMLCCLIACLGFASIFWFDLVKYDKYLPELDEIESIKIDIAGGGLYFDEQIESDGLTGDTLKDAYQLAKAVIHQDADSSETHGRFVEFEYRLKDDTVRRRQYYMDWEANIKLFDSIYATKEYKNDYCPLYTIDWSTITYIGWGDFVNDFKLNLTPSELEHLFETYLAEYTTLTYTEQEYEPALGHFHIYYESKSDHSEAGVGVDKVSDEYNIYPSFIQTIELLDQYLREDENAEYYGSITDSLLDRYEINFVEIYTPEEPTFINDKNEIESIKSSIILGNNGSKYAKSIDYDEYYELQINFKTVNAHANVYGFVPKEIADQFIK